MLVYQRVKPPVPPVIPSSSRVHRSQPQRKPSATCFAVTSRRGARSIMACRAPKYSKVTWKKGHILQQDMEKSWLSHGGFMVDSPIHEVWLGNSHVEKWTEKWTEIMKMHAKIRHLIPLSELKNDELYRQVPALCTTRPTRRLFTRLHVPCGAQQHCTTPPGVGSRTLLGWGWEKKGSAVLQKK